MKLRHHTMEDMSGKRAQKKQNKTHTPNHSAQAHNFIFCAHGFIKIKINYRKLEITKIQNLSAQAHNSHFIFCALGIIHVSHSSHACVLAFRSPLKAFKKPQDYKFHAHKLSHFNFVRL